MKILNLYLYYSPSSLFVSFLDIIIESIGFSLIFLIFFHRFQSNQIESCLFELYILCLHKDMMIKSIIELIILLLLNPIKKPKYLIQFKS